MQLIVWIYFKDEVDAGDDDTEKFNKVCKYCITEPDLEIGWYKTELVNEMQFTYPKGACSKYAIRTGGLCTEIVDESAKWRKLRQWNP